MAGLDEAGRGPLAGPVVAAVVAIRNPGFKFYVSSFKNIKDSKQLTPKRREKFFKILTNHPEIEWGIGRVSEKVIDKINILEATKLAMAKAIKNLKLKTYNLKHKNLKLDFLILDGNFEINSILPQKSIIKGDEKVFSCAAASIIAKVTRDRIMLKYDKKYSKYGFAQHKGYPTKLHRKMLRKIGPCLIHRKTFWPVKVLGE